MKESILPSVGTESDDPLVEFDGMFWTKSELLMYAAAALIHRMSQSPDKDEQ